VLLQAAMLFYLSSQKALVVRGHGWDKVAHFVAYGILSALWIRALHGGFTRLRLRPTLAAVALTGLYGASDELHQYFVPGRDSSGYDLLADFGGAVAAAAVLALWSRWPRGAPRPLSAESE
jgi:VanZ family protein